MIVALISSIRQAGFKENQVEDYSILAGDFLHMPLTKSQSASTCIPLCTAVALATTTISAYAKLSNGHCLAAKQPLARRTTAKAALTI